MSSGETERERPYESKKENKMKQAEQSVPLWKDILSLFIKLGILALLFLAMFTFVFGLFRNQDADMYPILKTVIWWSIIGWIKTIQPGI